MYNHVGNRESASFEYAPDWLGGPNSFAIDPALPLVAGPQFHKASKGGSVFHGAIADTGPDGWGERVIRRDHARRRFTALAEGREEPPPILGQLDLLLGVDDESRVGALRLQDKTGAFCRAPELARRTTPPAFDLSRVIAASRAIEENTETEQDLACLRGRGTSLGGMRPKCSIMTTSGAMAIGKFPSIKDTGAVTKAEVVALRLAREAGITAARAELIDSDGVPVAMIYRFDREDSRRIPYMSAATMLSADSSNATDHAYTEIADRLRQTGAAPQQDIEELWRRVAYSILITNTDDHLLNHGFLHADRGLWRLAPAFDLNPTPERAREFKTWITEASGPEATIDALMDATQHFGLSPQRARQILSEVEAAVARWRDIGKNIGMTVAELDHFAPAFEHQERRAAARALSAPVAWPRGLV
jgi:serine/threonine-protein kinase HipA